MNRFSNRSSTRAACMLALTSAALVLGACAKSKEAATMSPGAADAAVPADYADGGAEAGVTLEENLEDSLSELEAELARLDGDMTSTTTPKPAARPDPSGGEAMKSTDSAAVDTSADRCERICNLQTAICDVSERICDLASRPEHSDDARYADACERSEARCDQARDACDTCE